MMSLLGQQPRWFELSPFTDLDKKLVHAHVNISASYWLIVYPYSHLTILTYAHWQGVRGIYPSQELSAFLEIKQVLSAIWIWRVKHLCHIDYSNCRIVIFSGSWIIIVIFVILIIVWIKSRQICLDDTESNNSHWLDDPCTWCCMAQVFPSYATCLARNCINNIKIIKIVIKQCDYNDGHGITVLWSY